MLLSNKTSIVTGCNKGIGKSILEEFSKNGANIFACTRVLNKEFHSLTSEIEKKYNNKIIPIEIDLSDEESVKEGAKKILSYDTKIDILINNAASIFSSVFQMTSIKKYKELFNINFHSQVLLTQFIIKSMIKNKNGNIVFISSSAAIDGNEGRSAYVSTKAAIIGQAKVLSRELGKYNIKVNTIAPGLTNTEMMKKNTPPKTVDDMIANISLNRIGDPKEIANVALFLSSNLSDYITGQVIRVDGGM
jgi:3-oxoacyl-[acyl-carrier protein] reductase